MTFDLAFWNCSPTLRRLVLSRTTEYESNPTSGGKAFAAKALLREDTGLPADRQVREGRCQSLMRAAGKPVAASPTPGRTFTLENVRKSEERT